MRILMACAAFPPFMDGGGPMSAFSVAKSLVKAGHELLVVNVGDEDADEDYEGIPVRRLAPLNIYWNYYKPRPAWKKIVWHALENFNPRAFVRMRTEIRRFDPDIVLTFSTENINVATWPAAKSLGVPVCHHACSGFLMCWKGTMRRNGRNCESPCSDCRLTSLGKKLMSRFVDGVTGESSYIVEKHVANGYFPNAVARSIPGAIDTFHPRNRSIGKDDTKPLRVGFIGVHIPYKGLDTLAEASHRFNADEPIEFIIAGSGRDEYAAALPAKFNDHKTTFVGWIRPDEFFPTIDVLVVPSIGNEPFGRVTIEAFSHGVPVIGARSGGIPECIDDGVNGYVFTPADASALADHLRRILDDPDHYNRLSTGAHSCAERYLPHRISAEYTAFLEELRNRADQPAVSQSNLVSQ